MVVGQLEPIEGVLAVVDAGRSSGTNKFGLVLALIDLATSAPPDEFIADAALAAKLIEVHWDHVEPFRAHVLRQTADR